MYSAEKHLGPEQVEWLINGKESDGAVERPLNSGTKRVSTLHSARHVKSWFTCRRN